MCSVKQHALGQLYDSLQKLSKAIREVEDALTVMKADHDPLPSRISCLADNIREANDTKSAKRGEIVAQLSSNHACSLVCRSLNEWERPRR